MTEPLNREVLLARQLEKARMELADQRSMNKRLLRGPQVSFERVVEELKAAQSSSVMPSKSKFVTQKPKTTPHVKSGHSETATAMISDLHLSERVRLQESNNINIYSSMVAANRMWEHVTTIKQILSLHKSLYKLDQLWVPILGDMINGSIHPELALTNDLTDPAATVLAARLLGMAVTELTSLGLPIEADCIVGNHPRLTLKMPTKRVAHLSFDWVVYEMFADQFKKNDQVKVNVHTGQIALVEKYGWRFALEHGIDVSSGAEEALEDRIRALFDDPTYRQATGLEGASFDMILMGNMHKSKVLERTRVNGCYTGQNELGMSWRLKPIKAIQQLFGISEKHLNTWSYDLDLTHIKSEKVDNPFGEYCKWYMNRHGR
jgi:hypothetical protein